MPASSESRRTDSRAEPRCSRMNSPRSCQRLGVSAGTQSSVLPRFSGIGRPAVPGLSSVSEPCERPLQASPTKDALDSTLFECCPTKTGGGEVEAVLGGVHLRAHEGGVLQLLESLGNDARELPPEHLARAGSAEVLRLIVDELVGNAVTSIPESAFGPPTVTELSSAPGPPGPNPLVMTSDASWTSDSALTRSNSACKVRPRRLTRFILLAEHR